MARKLITSRRKERFVSVIAWISVLGITLGVATLIIVMAVMNGFRQELLDKILGLNGHVIVYPSDSRFTDYRDVAEQLRGLDIVVNAVPLVEGQVMASGPINASGALLRGIMPEDVDRIGALSGSITQGDLQAFREGRGVIVGSRLAQSLGVLAGDNVTLVTPRGAVTPFGTTPKVRAFPVTAIFEMGMSEYDGTFVFMPMGLAQNYLNMEDVAQAVEVFIDHPDLVDTALTEIANTIERPIFLSDWRRQNATFFNTLQVERNVMFLILTLIVLIAALNIISGLITLVRDKSGDIAILRTMGAGKSMILRIFFIAGASIGVVGTIAGFILGVIICLNIEAIRQGISAITGAELFAPEVYYLSQLPAEMDPGEVLAVIFMALGLSFIATLYPSWRAASLDPVDVLRQS